MYKMAESQALVTMESLQTSTNQSMSDSPPSVTFISRLNSDDHCRSTESVRFSKYQVETVYTGISQRVDQSVFAVMTFPSVTKVISVMLETPGITKIIQKVASVLGDTSGFEFDDKYEFAPGDYCFGFVLETEAQAQLISGIHFEILAKPVSNLMLSQMIFGLYRNLGLEPSHVMSYPGKSRKTSYSFYRKLRSETSAISKTLASMQQDILDLKSLNEKSPDNTIDTSISEMCGLTSKMLDVSENVSNVVCETLTAVRESQQDVAEIREQYELSQKGRECTMSLIEEVKKDLMDEIKARQESHDSLFNKILASTEEIQHSLNQPNSNDVAGDLSALQSSIDKHCNDNNDFYARLIDDIRSSKEHIQALSKEFRQIPNESARNVLSILGAVPEQLRKLSETFINTQERLEDISTVQNQTETHLATFETIDFATSAQLETIQNQLSDLLQCTTDDEKGSDIQTVSVIDIDNLLKEKEKYYSKLVEAEDYIDHLEGVRI